MSVFQFHGTADALVPYDGNASAGIPSVLDTLVGWAARSGCEAIPRVTSTKGDVTCVTFAGCRASAEVNLCTVLGGGHTWPGGLPVPWLGPTTTDIAATDVMWDFFLRHPMPVDPGRSGR
jgi:polyhydroxybutyrate depolymerase